jgi:hypothetical protein
MKMNRTLLKQIIPLALSWTGMIVFCGANAVAQDQAPATASAAVSPAQAADQRTDGQIEMDVVHALDASKALKKDLITAATIQREVTLSGTVSSAASSELAESIVGHVSGVIAVHNNLKVGNPQAAQEAAPVNAAEPGAQQMADSQPDEGPMPPAQGLPQRSPAPDQAQAPYPPPQPRPQYAPAPQAPAYPAQPAYEAPKGPVTVSAGTLLQVRTSEPVSTKNAKDGTPVQFVVIHDVAYGGVLAIPRGATVHGVVTESKKAGTLGGSPELALTLTSLDLGGQSYPIQSDQFKVKGPNKAGETVGSALGGGVIGTIIGCAVGRGVGCAIGAGAGVAAGTAASAASSGPGVWIPAEALVEFHLAAPVTVTPVSQQEASRLAQGLYPGGPSLYRRGGYYRPGYPYGLPYYPYPPVYYRPYFVTGGIYYWR